MANDPLFAGIQSPTASIFDIEGQLREGFNRLRANQMLHRTEDPADEQYCRLCQSCATQPIEVVLSPQQVQQRDATARILEARCKSCHLVGGRLPALVGIDLIDDVVRGPASKCMLVAPRDKEHSYLWQKVQPNVEGDCRRAANRMPLAAQPLTAEELSAIDTWIAGLPQNAGCKTCKRLASRCDPVPKLKVDPREGFALMVATGVANRVWREALGFPLTIANYFPRSSDQGAMLRVLTETTLIANRFSLKELLVHILTSPYFNRRPTDANGQGYVMPLVYDPWVELDSRRPPVADEGWRPGAGPPKPNDAYDPTASPQNHKNAATEAIRRYPAYTLLRSVREALGWPAGPDFWSTFANDDSLEYAKAAGLFIRDSEPGFRGISLESLLVWEARNGTCRRPQDVDRDWIDRLIEEVKQQNGGNPASPVTNREMAAAVKDWLIGTFAIDNGEEAEGIARLLGWSPTLPASARDFLDSHVSLGPDATDGVRKYCGVLLQSPQFQLAGMAAADLQSPPHDATALEPRLRVCNGEPCRYHAMCEALVSHLPANTASLVCTKQADSPLVAATLSASDARAAAELDAICPPGQCYLHRLPDACRNSPENCVDRMALCDPRVDACGAPTSPAGRLQALRAGAVLVSELEGALIVETTPDIRRRNIQGSETLAAHDSRLAAGDVLRLKPGQALTLEKVTGTAKPRTDAVAGERRDRLSLQSVGSGANTASQVPDPLVVIVTGPALRSRMMSERAVYHSDAASLAGEREEPWLRHGEAGSPLRSDPLLPPRTDSYELEKRRQAMPAPRAASPPK